MPVAESNPPVTPVGSAPNANVSSPTTLPIRVTVARLRLGLSVSVTVNPPVTASAPWLSVYGSGVVVVLITGAAFTTI